METQAAYKTEEKKLIPEVYTLEIEKAQKEGCNLLLPSTRIEGLSPLHVPVVDRVYLNSDTTQGDVYVQEKGNNSKSTKYAITKQGLMKISVCAGVIWHPGETRRTDNRGDRNYVSYQAVGGVRKADGTPVFFKAEYDLDFEVLQDEIEEQYQGKAEKWDKDAEKYPDDYKWWTRMNNEAQEAYIQKCIRRDLLQKRKHKMKLAESGAMNRVIRALLGLKSTYTKTELEKPFVVVRISLRPDYSDPQVKAKLLDAAIKSMTGIYGGGSIPEWQPTTLPHEDAIIDLPPADDIQDTEDQSEDFPDPEPGEEEKGNPGPDPDADFHNASKDDQEAALRALMDRKGYDEKTLKRHLEKFSTEERANFWKFLNQMPDLKPAPAKDDIPFG